MNRICVFCGSSRGARPEYAAASRNLGAALARRGLGVVFGGSRVGNMGELAASALEAGGEVIGVITRDLVDKRVALSSLRDLRIVESLHERKKLMADLSDGFVALPGGLGTLDELFDILSWAQLGLHPKPCGLLDVAGYYERLTAFLDHAAAEGFIEREHRAMLLVDEGADSLLDRFARYEPPRVDKAVRALQAMPGPAGGAGD